MLWGVEHLFSQLLVTVLAGILTLILSILIVLILQSFFTSFEALFDWMKHPHVMTSIILSVTTLILGTWLIFSQLRTSIGLSFLQAFMLTVLAISLVILTHVSLGIQPA
jgi:hypothetical protein